MKAYVKLSSLVTLLLATTQSCSDQREVYPERRSIRQSVFATGHIVHEDEYVISASVDGIIEELAIEEGDSVTEGAFLLRIKSDLQQAYLQESELIYQDALQNASLNSPRLRQIQVQVEQAQTQVDQDFRNYQRYVQLRKSNSVSQADFEKIELQYVASKSNLEVLQKSYTELQNTLQLNAARSSKQVRSQEAILEDYMVEADKSGLVLNVYKRKGELVRRGEVIARIGSGTPILKLYIAEEDITQITPQQEVIVQLNTYPDTTFSARLTHILPAFDSEQQSYCAEAVLTNPPTILLSGTQLQANILCGIRKDVLVIPSNALIRGNFVTLTDGTEKQIVTGQKTGSWVEVKSGITVRDQLIIRSENTEKNENNAFPGAE